jgi:hypothetical protein
VTIGIRQRRVMVSLLVLIAQIALASALLAQRGALPASAQGGARGGGRGGGLPGATPEQTQAVADMTAALTDVTAAVAAAGAELAVATYGGAANSPAIKAAVEKVRAAEVVLASKRAAEFAKIQASPNKLNEEQVRALIAASGNPGGGRGRGGAGRGGF